MAEQRITIEVVGAPEDEGHPRLSDLISQLELVNSALGNTERLVSGKDKRFLYFRVVDVSHDSPLRVVLEPVVSNPKKVASVLARETVSSFVSNLRQIKRGRVSADVDLQALESYRRLTEVLEKHHVSHLSISNGRGKKAVEIDEKFKIRLDKIIGPDEMMRGSLSGRLEWLNLHNKNVFNIYPVIGATKVSCSFGAELRRTVIDAIDKYVTVYGTLKFKQRDNFPYAMTVDDLEALPEYDDTPTLYELRGIAPNATGDLSAVDFVRRLRNESQ